MARKLEEWFQQIPGIASEISIQKRCTNTDIAKILRRIFQNSCRETEAENGPYGPYTHRDCEKEIFVVYGKILRFSQQKIFFKNYLNYWQYPVDFTRDFHISPSMTLVNSKKNVHRQHNNTPLQYNMHHSLKAF